MSKYTLQLHFYQVQAGNENARVRIEFDGDILAETFEITATSKLSPSITPEYNINKLPGSYDLSVIFLNDFYDEDTSSDRNVIWCDTVVSGGGVYWTHIDYNGKGAKKDVVPSHPNIGWFEYPIYEENVPAVYTLCIPPQRPQGF